MPYANPAAKRAYDAARYRADRATAIERARVYREANPGLIAQRTRGYRARNQSRLRMVHARYYQLNRTRKDAQNKAWRDRHPKVRAAHTRRWKDRNPYKNAEYKSRRSARLRGAGIIEKFAKEEIYERDRWVCQICHLPAKKADASLDHILPVSKGGAHTRVNVRLAHRLCNVRRGNRQ